MSDRYAVVAESGEVVNVIIWKGDPYVPQVGHSLIYGPVADIGDSVDIQTGILTKIDRTAID